MLLESIKLHNFRQFRDESIDFAQGENGKNVTIIIGENGTGKTTFAQAFFWCMYGETEFSDKTILNKVVAAEMRPGQEERVKVTLSLRHGAVGYTLIREQVYRKDYNNNVKGDNTIFDIAIKDAGGNTNYLKKTQCEAEVKGILPKELSRYFFFDGERIEKMSKDISSGKKSTDFAEAVKGLLGLNGFISAIAHFNPRSKNGVIGSYDSSFDAKSNKKISEYTDTIDRCNREIERLEARLETLDSQIESAKQRKGEKTEEIKQYAEGEELQEQKEKLQKQIRNAEIARSNVYKAICKDFNSSMSTFFSMTLMKRALAFLAQEDFTGKDIPFMHTKTIEYLIKQKVCICGTHLDEGSVPYNKVMELINYLPPQSISTTISDFKKEARRRAGNSDDIVSQVQENLAVISSQDDDIADKVDDIQSIDKKLSGGDVREKVRTINAEIQMCDETIRKSEDEKQKCDREIGGYIKERDRADAERRNLTLLDERNRKIEIYKAYAERIYSELLEVYSTSEAEIRKKLQDTINDIFKQIYEGGLYLTIDDKYHISVYANDYEGDVETSTAQSISVIFAFITGIIKMARENRNAADDDAKLLSSEPYPLVMDAPLSAFDKRRIKTVCEALPKTAEQVIIFIKDTDGELAEDYMGDKIGSRHRFDKLNEFETVLA
ncbi:AAA family ATPase [Enterocloster clostridioformis]|uniref:AAA family ATPase n=1 Tax=Enterocloster clostridioformis TaxID=1531 RepID=UPI0018A94C5F|nr:AAA family ATPase [Enterocloster clostridioformis]MDB2127500.1 AAA family ATPase [Enterocloster clostridioformis]